MYALPSERKVPSGGSSQSAVPSTIYNRDDIIRWGLQRMAVNVESFEEFDKHRDDPVFMDYLLKSH